MPTPYQRKWALIILWTGALVVLLFGILYSISHDEKRRLAMEDCYYKGGFAVENLQGRYVCVKPAYGEEKP